MIKRIAIGLATTFYSGFFPIAPGTVGAFIAIVVLWVVPQMTWYLLAGLSVVFFFIGVWASFFAEQEWGKDPGRVNWDEVVGMMVTVIALPKHWIIYVAAFFLFRLFDIVKPYPVNRVEKWKSGWGIMSDDVLAGLYSNIILQLVYPWLLALVSKV